ncbi:ArnT family glycosyltransferase [Synechococcus sp. CCY9202]|uniref:ArnT family glycosyltransferase n=1 Tax=Synechococcus sp. CCY9202 TaxID=174698 RepID=UPI002B209949|nr:glycosyltransferase family 39 protein [Synechococcus sp. CCY9202]MEA5424643.1 glycosyltransferase family 39 protein [Synechococcus sp. CCY9202]
MHRSRDPGPWLPLGLSAALRLVQIWMPIVGVHSWRQADTAAMARHFAGNGLVFWLPQIDWAGASPGYVESEFPLSPYLSALLYRLFGVHEWLARGLAVTFSLLTLWLVIRIGSQLFGPSAGWWGGLFFGVLPSSVYFGRSVQPEPLLMLLAALAFERLLAWRERRQRRDLLLSWLAFTGACLLKVFPLLWLGLPMLWLWHRQPNRQATTVGWAGPMVFGLASVVVTALWYWHAYRLGQASGLSFGFWGDDVDRANPLALLGWRYWLELLLRIAVRNLAVLGVPLLVLGLGAAPARGGTALIVGVAAVLGAGALAARSSAVHEYYQLPLMLFACPLMGLGWEQLRQRWAAPPRQWIAFGGLALLLAGSLTILSLDYWRVERQQLQQLGPLAAAIRATTAPGDRIVAVTGPDPTLLNLAQRQGWLVSPGKVSAKAIRRWRRQGAVVLAGSLDTIESFRPFDHGTERQKLVQTLCQLHENVTGSESRSATSAGDPSATKTACPWPEQSWYVMPLN